MLPAGRACEADGRIPLDPRVPADREALLAVIWGDAGVRASLLAASQGQAPRRARAAVISSGIWAAVATFAEMSSTWVLVTSATAGVVAALLALRRRMQVVPSGGTSPPPPRRYAAGVIEAADELISGGSGTPCAGWAIELRHEGSWPARTTLRVAMCAGMVIALDGGARARIPAGPVWFEGALPQLGDLESSIEDLLGTLDPARSRHDPWPLFPFNVVVEQTLHLGDRVEVLGDYAPVFVPGAAQPLYRDAPSTELAPTAVPVLRLI